MNENIVSNRSIAIKKAVDEGNLRVEFEPLVIYGRNNKPLRVSRNSSRSHPYSRVNVYFGKGKSVMGDVHRIVAYIKFGDIALQKGSVIDHVNNDKWDNRPENLELVSHTINMNKAKADGWISVIVDGEVIALCRSQADAHLLQNEHGY